MNKPHKLRVGHLGVGGHGAYRRHLMRQTGLFEVLVVCDYNPENLAHAAKEEEATPVDSVEEFFDFPGLEAVIISTGAKYHAEQVVAAMERGLHVFVEKPLCASLEEVFQIRAAQQSSGVVCSVGHTALQDDAVASAIKEVLDEKLLGTVAAVEKTTAHSGGHKIKPGDWRGDPDKNPGGMLFQCGVHALHELMFYFGPIEEVSAFMRYDVLPTGTADAANCLLKFQSGLIGTLNAYHVSGYRHHMAIFGTQGNLYKDERHYHEGTKLFLQPRDEEGGWEPQEILPVFGEGDECGSLRRFFRAVREGCEPSPSLEDGARAVLAVFAAEKSVATGRPVKLADLCSPAESPLNCLEGKAKPVAQGSDGEARMASSSPAHCA